MPTLARTHAASHAPRAARRVLQPAAGTASNSELAQDLDAAPSSETAEGSIWDAIAADVGGAPPPGASGTAAAPSPPPPAPPPTSTPSPAEQARAASIAKNKHEKGDYGPTPLDPAQIGVVDTDYVGAWKTWTEHRKEHRAAQEAERIAANALDAKRGERERAEAALRTAEGELGQAHRKEARDNRVAAAKVAEAREKLEAAKKAEAEARAPYDAAKQRREEVEARTTDAKTRVLQQAAKLDLPGLQDDERRAEGPLKTATTRREEAQKQLDAATEAEAETQRAGKARVDAATGTRNRKAEEVDSAKTDEQRAKGASDTAKDDTKKKAKDARKTWFDPTRFERGSSPPDDDGSGTGNGRRPSWLKSKVKESSASGVRIGGRDRVRASAKVETNKVGFDNELKTSFGSGGALTTEKGFKGDIPETHKARASGLAAGAGEGADGVFFQSTRGKNQTAANGQAFVGDAGAQAGAVAKDGDWAKGDTIGVHAQAKARAAAAGAAASANAAASGGPALGGIDPITGERKGMLSAEAGIDADVRLLEIGASADAQASVKGTRAQASIDAAADATLAKVSGGVGGKAGVELGGWKMAGAQADASGSAAVTARASASAGAEVGLSGVKAKAAGEAMIGAEAQGQAQAKGTLLGIDQGIGASGRAMAGAEASGEVGAGLNLAKGDAFVKAQGDAFAGAKAEGSVQMGFGMGDMDLVTLSLHGSALAGAGIGGTFLAGMVDGAFEFFAEASAALGVGLGGGFGLNVGVFVPVKYALHLLNDNGVISNDPDEWIPQMVELGKTGRVLRSQQQGIDGWKNTDGLPPTADPQNPRLPRLMANDAPASTAVVGGLDAMLAAPDLGAPAPEQGPSPSFAEPAGASAWAPTDFDGPQSRSGRAVLLRPAAFDLDEIAEVAEEDAGFGDLAIEIAQTQAVLEKEMAPLADLEERWLEGFNDEASELVDGLAGPLQGLWGLVDTAISGITALLSGNLGGVLSAGQGLIAGAGELIAGGWALLGQAFTDPIGAIRSFFAKFDGLRAGAEAVFGGLLGGMGSLTDVFAGRIGPARALSGMIRGMAEGILDILIDHGHEAADDVRAVGDKADQVLDQPVDGEALPGVTLALDDRARDAIDEDAERIEEIGGEASGRVLGAVDQAADHVDGYIAAAVDHAASLVTDAIGGARRVFDSIKDAVVGQIAAAQSSLLVRAAQMVAERIAAAARAIAAFFGWR